MIWWLAGLAVLMGLGLILGAPYVPTHKKQVSQAVRMLGLRPGQLMVELGAGDGRIALAAAKKGIKVEAFEINPLLFLLAWLRTRRYRHLVRVRLADFKSSSWPPDTKALYVFGNKFILNYLAVRLQRWPRPIRLVSYGFELPGHEPVKQTDGLWAYKIKPQ
jgi:hypothetical protein